MPPYIPPWPPVNPPAPPTVDDIRRIVREEIEKALINKEINEKLKTWKPPE
jgi:hypothetical protein